MTEIEQLKADLATLEAAKKIDIKLVTYYRLNQEIDYIEKRIADLEAQAPVDVWAEIKEYWERKVMICDSMQKQNIKANIS